MAALPLLASGFTGRSWHPLGYRVPSMIHWRVLTHIRNLSETEALALGR